MHHLRSEHNGEMHYLVIIFLLFVAAFALMPNAVRSLGDSSPTLVKALAAIGAMSWIAGCAIQIAKTGYISAPYA